MDICKGRVTLPAESGQEKVVMALAKKWGVDALRDSDGTTLSAEILAMGFDIYSTVCIVRADQQWPRQNPTHLPQQFLMSPRVTSQGGSLTIDLLQDYFDQKYRINTDDSPHQWWEVIDRTTGQVIPTTDWHCDQGRVTIQRTLPYHQYTVNFLAYQTWDSTSMYNHLTNKWTCEKVISLNPFIPAVYDHLMKYFDAWLESHPQTDIVRLTTLAFHFTLVSNPQAKNVIRDWTGYSETVSPAALLAFEKAKGYRLRSEDFVDNGCYNITYRPPTSQYLDWIDFIHEFVVRFGRDMVSRVHAAGKKAAMFWGDHWIGTEPYSPKFQEIGIDIHVGAAEDGCALRRISDAPGPQTKELRFYPYFFPDVFRPGGNPQAESLNNWMKIRRALLRQPIDRIGWGGYLSLAAKFPEFTDHLAAIADEFRQFHEQTQAQPAYIAPVKVALLNCWGSQRAWINQVGPVEKFYSGREDVMEFIGSNVLESLAGLPIQLQFISFRDILADPNLLQNFHVVINEGTAHSAWSGGTIWTNPDIVAALRGFVLQGGGFVGIGEPTACQYQGSFFQLADILGVQKETGRTIQVNGCPGENPVPHFITEDLTEPFDTITDQSFVFSVSSQTQILDIRSAHIHLTAHQADAGRSVYISSLPFNWSNARLLHRAIFWAAKKEDQLQQCFSSNPNTDCAYYPNKKIYAVVNNTSGPAETQMFDISGQAKSITLAPHEIKWVV